MTDPIADMLTRIRNAITAKKETVEIPASNEKKAIAEILLEEGWVKDVKLVEDGYNGKIVITLKYDDKKSVISGLRRVSKQHHRIRFPSWSLHRLPHSYCDRVHSPQ